MWACSLTADSRLVYFAIFDSQPTYNVMCTCKQTGECSYIRSVTSGHRIKTQAFLRFRKLAKTAFTI